MHRYPSRRTIRALPRHDRRVTLMVLLTGLPLLLLWLAPPASAAPLRIIFDPFATPSQTAWIAGTGAGYDQASCVLALPGDTVLVAGALTGGAGTADLSLTRYVRGTFKWTRTWDGPSHLEDAAVAMALAPGGKDVYIAGFTARSMSSTQIVMVKRSVKTGALRWARRGSVPGAAMGVPTDVTVDSFGNVTASGYALTPPTGADAVVMSWTPSGARRWLWRHNGPGNGNDYAAAIQPGPSGSVYLTGGATVAGPTQATLTARLSPAGKKVWLKSYTGPEGLGAICFDSAPRPGGGIYVCGSTQRAATDRDGMILRYSPKGARQMIALDADGGGLTQQSFAAVVVTSTKAIVGAGYSGPAANRDPHVAAYRANGAAIGAWTFPSAWDDSFEAVAGDSFGGFFATGTFMTGPAASTIATLRGSVLTGGGGFASSWANAASTDNRANDIAVSGTTAYVAGLGASGGATGTDQVLLTYIW